MDNKELISVIVPIYNSRPYLEKCFRSIVNQSYQQMEIILVDDGSTDGSGELCDELCRRDERVRVIHKKNGGTGSAKNAGLAAAHGEYIALVDSDDWIEPGMYLALKKMMDRDHAQIGVCGIQKVNDAGQKSYYNDDLSEKTVFSREAALIELPKNERITNSMCNKLFHIEMLKGLKMNESIAYDDNPFVSQCIARAERIAYTAEPFYCYYQRQDSVSRNAFSLKEFDRVTADRMRLDFYHEHFPQCEFAAAIACIGSGLKVYYQSRCCREARKRRAQLREELKQMIRNYSDLPFTEKQRAKAKLFLISPALYTASMKLRGK